jgi:hypothetical protein
VADCGEVLVAATGDIADELLAARDADADLERPGRRFGVADSTHERPGRLDSLPAVVRAGETRHEQASISSPAI